MIFKIFQEMVAFLIMFGMNNQQQPQNQTPPWTAPNDNNPMTSGILCTECMRIQNN